MEKINLDFCIVENPFNEKNKHLIFVTERGLNHLNDEVVETEEYEWALMEIQIFGYIEIDNLTFEKEINQDMPEIPVGEIKSVLISKGMKYSKKLEKSIKEEFDVLNKHKESMTKSFLSNINHLKKENKYISATKYKVPEIGDRISLYFYLFLECKFLENGDCFINLNGDFVSRKNGPTRNYIRVVKSDFIRVPSEENEKVFLKCERTHEDLFREIDLFHSGNFNLTTISQIGDSDKEEILSKSYMYNILEIKDSIKKDNRISIIVDRDYNFDEMIELSKIRKTEKIAEDRSVIDMDFLPDSKVELTRILEKRMFTFAENEEYEKANTAKKNINFLSDRVTLLGNLDKDKITKYELKKICHI